MPLLGALLVSLLSGLAGFLAQFLVRKVAVAAAAVAAFGVAIAALLVVFNAAVSPLLANLFSTSYGSFIGLAFPPCAGTCMATVGAVWAACGLYRWQAKAISLAAAA